MTNMKGVFRKLLSIIILQIVFCIMLVLVNLIPKSQVKDNILSSADILHEEGLYYTPTSFNKSIIKWDNWTMALVYGALWVETDESSLTSFVHSYTLSGKEKPVENLWQSVRGDNYSIREYSRYWFGLLVILRPLTVFLNLTEIRACFFLVSIALLFFTTIEVIKDISIYHGIAFLFTYISCGLLLMTPCPVYSMDVMLSIIGTCYLISYIKRKERVIVDIIFAFMIIGSCTMFFCFVSFPIITLGIPLMTLIAFYSTNYNVTIVELIKKMFFSILGWGVGYLFTMLFKSLLVRLAGGLPTAGGRFKEIVGKQGMHERIKIIFDRSFGCSGMYTSSIKLMIAVSIIIILLVALYNKKVYIGLIKYQFVIIVYLILAFLPAGYCFTLAQHSSIHGAAGVTFCITTYALFLIVISLVVKVKR